MVRLMGPVGLPSWGRSRPRWFPRDPPQGEKRTTPSGPASRRVTSTTADVAAFGAGREAPVEAAEAPDPLALGSRVSAVFVGFERSDEHALVTMSEAAITMTPSPITSFPLLCLRIPYSLNPHPPPCSGGGMTIADTGSASPRQTRSARTM